MTDKYLSIRERFRYRSLRQAISRGNILPWYQPLIYGANRKIVGCEILARWQRSFFTRKPDAFIPFAERSGLILPLTRQLMHQAGQELKSLKGWLPEGFTVSVNLCAAHADSGTFLRDCLRLRRELDFCRAEVCAEITEREAFEDIKGAGQFISHLRENGIRVFLDDFGTGHTGMRTLRSFQVDGLKLDRRYVGMLPASRSLPETILMLARDRGLMMVAEGVENLAQHEWLLAHGVELQQGFLFSPPLSFMDFRTYMVSGLTYREAW